jgi:HEAT repeat protein
MAFVSESSLFLPLDTALGAYALAVLVLVAFIAARRISRSRYFIVRDARAFAIRQQWNDIMKGVIPADHWRKNPMDREVVETMLLDNIEAADETGLPPLLELLRSTGLLDMRLYEARHTDGWRQRSALVALGRTRAPEAIPFLVDMLNSPSVEVRTAAVRGLGAVGLFNAALPILENLSTGELNVPMAAVSAALVQCCQRNPRVLLTYFHLTTGATRELIARVMAELDLSSLGEELISLAHDVSAEVRACAARGLPKLHASIAVPMLEQLSADESWFVRLRAVIALGSIPSPDAVEVLVARLQDSHRLVRQRAAAALVMRGDQLRSIVEQTISLGDNYGLQALVSELERVGITKRLLKELRSAGVLKAVVALEDAREKLALGLGARDATL